MIRRLVLTTCWAAAVSLSFATVAGAGSSADQDRADAAITAFDDEVQAAGFTSSGSGDEGDVLDLGDSDEDSGDVDPATACFGDLSPVIADDGSFVGETARATSDTYSRPTATAGTAGTGGIGGIESSFDDTITAVVALVDDTNVDGVSMVVEQFGSAEIANCLTKALGAGFDASVGSYDVTNTDDLGVGDESTQISIGVTSTAGDDQFEFRTTLSLALVDRALLIVFADDSGDPIEPSGELILAEMVDALTT